MNEIFEKAILDATGASSFYEIETIQQLWSGYGRIVRYGLRGSSMQSIVVKHVKLAKVKKHPRGWNNDISHNRKLRSYQVETAWYDAFSSLCGEDTRVPKCFALEKDGDEVFIVLEDLDASGFSKRKSRASWADVTVCLSWLANFHATFMGKKPSNLWKIGTYWHLKTRPEELKVLKDHDLKKAAKEIDQILQNSNFLTFVHGDAKLANFCFSWNSKQVAAVDFQYVGGGCGMKDVAYFIGSCFHEEEAERFESKILDYYFDELKKALLSKGKELDANAIEGEWRGLYHVAWADFHRFLKGWSPDHWKINSYSEKVTREVLERINSVKS